MSLAASLETWRAGARRIGDGAERLACFVDGPADAAGPPLLLLHGYPTSSWDWRRLWAPLAARRRLIAVDLLGCGLSAKPADGGYGIAAQAARIEQLCAVLEITRADALGAEQGGLVVQELLARQGENRAAVRLRSAVLINAAAVPGAPKPRADDRRLAGPLGPPAAMLLGSRGFARSYARAFSRGAKPSAEEIAETWSLLAEEDGHRLGPRLSAWIRERRRQENRWAGALAARLAPARLILGERDPAAGAALARAVRRLRADADIVLLEDAGRWPQLETPDATLEAIESFLAAVARSAAP
jgi:pimeloyl-ACP methyl ester carboxylesterase